MERDYAEIEQLGPGHDVLCFQIYSTLNERMGTWTRKFFSYSPYEILRVDRYKYDGPDQDVYKAEGFNIDHINLLGETGCQNVNEIAKSFAVVREWDKNQDRCWHWAGSQMRLIAYLSKISYHWRRISESELQQKENSLARILKIITEGEMLKI